MLNHDIARTGVSATALRRAMFAGPDGVGVNACVACCDRWSDGDRIGLEWYGLDGSQTVRTHDALRDDASRFANLLTNRGVRPGDVVVGMLPRGVELLTVILGTWRAGAVFQPIATGSSAVAVDARINHTGRAAPKLVVTDMENRGTLGLVDFCPPVLVVTDGARARPGDGDFMSELMRQPAHYAPVARDGDDPFVLLVGGRCGQMRPVAPRLDSLMSILSGIQIGLEPDEAEIGWDVADPAWSYSLYFSVIRPLLAGDAVVAYESDRIASAAPRPVLVWTAEPVRAAVEELEDLELAA